MRTGDKCVENAVLESSMLFDHLRAHAVHEHVDRLIFLFLKMLTQQAVYIFLSGTNEPLRKSLPH